MSQAYDRFMKKRDDSKKKVTPAKFNLHKISFDDSDESSRSDIPNIFLDHREEVESPKSPAKPKKLEKERKPVNIVKQESLQQLNMKKSSSSSPAKKPEPYLQEQMEPYEQPAEIAQAEVEIEPNSSLSFMETIKLHLGQYLFRNVYPMSKTIYINNNNQEENQINKKDYLSRNKEEHKEILHYDNTIKVGLFLFTSVLLLRNIFGYVYIYAWIAVIVLQFVAESLLLDGIIQYGTSKVGMIIMVILAIIIQISSEIISLRKRRSWEENRNSYRVYHHNGHMAEWANVRAHQLKPGHVYKIQSGEYFPTDSVILHSESSLVYIKEGHLISQLVEFPSEHVLKQTLIKTENIVLPLSGYFNYEISNPEYSDFQVIGKLNLEEPEKISHPVSMSNISLRGSINSNDFDLLCLVMETGIDSLLMKHLQFPFQHRKAYEYSTPHRQYKISDDISAEIQQYQGTLLGLPLQKKVESLVLLFIFIYFLISGFGILAGFLYKITTPYEFYLSQAGIQIWKLVIYHFTNYIIFIPVLLIPIYKLYLALNAGITQTNISNRALQLMSQNQQHRRSNSLSEQSRSHHKQELLDNKKIVFPVKFKDYNILPQLANIDTIVTTIDTFRDESVYTLHSIRIKEINHNFMTNTLDNQIYSIEDVELIKYFMSVAILTTSQTDLDNAVNYESAIETAAKKYLDLKKNKNAHGQILVNGDQFKVKEIFSIRPIYNYPYKIIFLQPVTDSNEENPKTLVLIRGNAKIILDKTYGKDVKLTEEARKLQEQKGFHVELIAKISMSVNDTVDIQKAYTSSNMNIDFFYKNLDKYISKVEPMGLLVFVNQFYQKKIGESLRNPVLNKSLINQSKFERPLTYSSDVYASQHLPNLIILAPVSKSSQPQFEAIHTITNLLINPYMFNYTLSDVADKILHEKPSNLERMIDQLEEERILIWNGWDQKDISYTIQILKKYGKKILFYTQKDQYMFLMKQTDCSVKGSRLGYDSGKYSDISFTSKSSISYLYLTQLIRYDSLMIRQGALSIIFTQISKFIFYLVVEIINIFYTRGTALSIVKSPLYMVVEIVLILDVFYYLNWKDSGRADTYNKKDSFTKEILLKILETTFQAIFITFICFYSLQVPMDSTGTVQSYHFTYFAIVFSFLHVLIFDKLFNGFAPSFSFYKGIILAIQILSLYIGFIIVSAIDTYSYSGILYSAMNGKLLMTEIGVIWICLTLPAIRMLWNLMKSRSLKKGDKAKKTY